MMKAIGNKKANEIWEASKPQDKPKPTSTRAEKEKYIKEKYANLGYMCVL